MPKVAVVLSGCGVFDGSEIHEAVITLLALDRAGADIVIAAPDVEFEAVDHYSGKAAGERRNALVESARIARGKIVALAELRAADLDAVILPGGFGAAKTLSDFAVKGAKASANPELARLLRDMHKAGKPIGAMCIAPATVAAVFAEAGFSPRLTVGRDPGTAKAMAALGAAHAECPVGGIVTDEKHRIVSTPAYMLGKRIGDVAEGIEKLVAEVLRMAEA